jgi:hypothetical protein
MTNSGASSAESTSRPRVYPLVLRRAGICPATSGSTVKILPTSVALRCTVPIHLSRSPVAFSPWLLYQVSASVYIVDTRYCETDDTPMVPDDRVRGLSGIVFPCAASNSKSDEQML